MIEAKNLTKIFKVPTEEKSIFGAKKIDSAAVDDLSFSLKKGEVLIKNKFTFIISDLYIL